MNPASDLRSLAAAFVLLASLASAQISPADAMSSKTRWESIKARRLPEAARIEPGETSKSAEELVRDQVSSREHFVAIADEARAFRESEPEGEYASAARALEAASLVKAALLGDESAAARYPVLVESVRRDTRLLSPERFEVVALAELQMLRGMARNKGEFLIARENSARYLIAEFPGETGGYSSLLSVVDATEDPARVQAAVREVVNSAAPFAAKAQAQVLGQRYDLIGKSLADFANTVLGRDNIFEASRAEQALLYTWATWSRPSIEYARSIAAHARPGIRIYGVNLDRDVAAAKAVAEAQQLPGEQLYHEGGIGGPLALRLKLNAAPMVYLTDRRGIIRDVGAQRGDLAQRITSARSGNPQR